MSRILVIRFSAIGDVAMTVPVIHSFAVQYPQHEITVLSRIALEPLFQRLPENVTFLGVDLSGEYSGFLGVFRIFSQLMKMNFDYVADFHDVMRTKFLRLLFNLVGISTAHIHKGRAGKRRLVRRRHKILKNQKSSFHRYADVFERLGFPVVLNFLSIYGEGNGDFSQIQPIVGDKGRAKWVGMAPFAKHKGKIYPLELQEQVVVSLAKISGIKIFLFGGGKREQDVFDEWAMKYPWVVSLIGKLNMNTELNLMSHLDVMLSMDSANMHLASLVNTPVISIWGATHPYAGFMGWKQLPTNTIQFDLNCRPCSVYGQKPCWRKDYACMYGIKPEQVVGKIKSIIDVK